MNDQTSGTVRGRRSREPLRAVSRGCYGVSMRGNGRTRDLIGAVIVVVASIGAFFVNGWTSAAVMVVCAGAPVAAIAWRRARRPAAVRAAGGDASSSTTAG